MGMFSDIMAKIFRDSKPVIASTQPGVQSAEKPAVSNSPEQSGPVKPISPGSASALPKPAVPKEPQIQEVDVSAVLNDLAAKHTEKLDWKKSIVDLMKLVEMDSSLSARKELATELQYRGDMSDSASMNIWLHKEVIKQLAANGGKVPQELLD